MIQGVVPGGALTLISLTKAGTSHLTVPSGRSFDLSFLAVTYTCDATVVSRSVFVCVTLINGCVLYLSGCTPMTASLTYKIQWGVATAIPPGPNGSSTAGQLLPLYPGHDINLEVLAGVAGDDWKLEGVYFDRPMGIP